MLDDGDEAVRRPGSGRWINYADVRVNAQVASVQVSDRWLRVPWHGHVLLVSSTVNHRGWWLRMTAGERWVKRSSPDA